MKTKIVIVDKLLYGCAFVIGALAVIWTGALFAAATPLAFAITAVIGGVYTLGAIELFKFGRATQTLSRALDTTPERIDSLGDFLDRLDPSLRNAVRLRVEGERVGLPGPVLTPYLVGLLVMLGLLGTFAGMVNTLRGAVAALEGTTDLVAIRQGLAAPINGLGMAFGTSVAGVASSAMLGLMSTLSRRRRMMAVRRLDAFVPDRFRDFSLAHSQRETFRALQRQTESLPAVAGLLETVAGRLERLGQALTDQQERFHHAVAEPYEKLAGSMDRALKAHLADSVRLAGEAVKPVADAAMQAMAQETQAVCRHLARISQATLDGVGQRALDQSQAIAAAWQALLDGQRQADDALATRIQTTLEGSATRFDQAVAAMLERFNASAADWLARQAAGDRQRLDRWSGSMDAMQQQVAACFSDSATALTQAVETFSARAQETAVRVQTEMTRLADSSTDLIRSRRSAEDAWIAGHAARMDDLAHALGQQLGVLRDDEARRGQAAVDRLARLESTLGEHLSTLGRALEAPMARLIETASKAPRAAAGLVEQMRQETARQVHRDNRLLDERRRIAEQLDALAVSLNENLAGQRQAIDRLVDSSSAMLAEAGQRFAGQVAQDGAKLAAAADDFAVSAVEMASLGESFGAAVALFNASNQELVDHLTRIEAALENATARSDDQMGYVVTQAREIIEQSMLSQREIIESLQHLRPAQTVDLEAN